MWNGSLIWENAPLAKKPDRIKICVVVTRSLCYLHPYRGRYAGMMPDRTEQITMLQTGARGFITGEAVFL